MYEWDKLLGRFHMDYVLFLWVDVRFENDQGYNFYETYNFGGFLKQYGNILLEKYPNLHFTNKTCKI